jgi:hypothetical protein
VAGEARPRAQLVGAKHFEELEVEIPARYQQARPRQAAAKRRL